MNKIVLKGISKSFGQRELFKNVNIELQSGHIYGLTGPNGCGKSVLFKIICGLMKPTYGTINYNQWVLHQDIEILPSVGIVIDQGKFYGQLSGYENLYLLASIKGLIAEEKILEVLDLVELKNDTMAVKKYSLGMKQRLSIAQAIMEDPEVLLLDEITNGIDKSGIELIYKILNKEKEKGKIIFITSHRQVDIDNLCDKVYEIDSYEVIDIGKT